MPQPLTDTSILKRTDRQLSADVSGEAVIMQLDSGLYFGMDGVAAMIWRLLAEPRTFGAVCDAVLLEFDVDRDQCERDLRAFVEQGLDAGVIEWEDGGAG